jgi:hypothetical protein
MLQPKRLPLPDVGRGDLLVDIIARFPEVEDPLDNWWTLRYETSSWYCWRDLQPAALYDQELATLRKRRSQGVYEVVRAWEEPENTNPYLYIGRSGSGSLAERIRLLVRPPGKSNPHEQQSVRAKLIARAQEVLGVEDVAQVLPWLYIRWSVCDSPLGPALLEYYLHCLRNPLFAERNVSAHTERQECPAEWWVR